ncbi:hypothetical protein [Methanosphaera cuniculi]|uniref:hypothetical protein n=1 Tax=Methanosphaera cuniculi TaxID=1077256 RepID=UPI0026EB77AA|nr:hypothetical protein [Methanosphaera cuniculi]
MIFQIDTNMIITTSRKPSQLTRRFTQFIKHYFNLTYINRGKTSFNKIVNTTKQENIEKLVVITETKGNPSSINIYNIEKSTQTPVLSFYINTSIPSNKKTINVDSNNIYIINKAKSLSEINELFTEIKPDYKITENCVICKDTTHPDAIAEITFIDKNGKNTDYKIYINGYKIVEENII